MPVALSATVPEQRNDRHNGGKRQQKHPMHRDAPVVPFASHRLILPVQEKARKEHPRALVDDSIHSVRPEHFWTDMHVGRN
jgi:hypothetical protein